MLPQGTKLIAERFFAVNIELILILGFVSTLGVSLNTYITVSFRGCAGLATIWDFVLLFTKLSTAYNMSDNTRAGLVLVTATICDFSSLFTKFGTDRADLVLVVAPICNFSLHFTKLSTAYDMSGNTCAVLGYMPTAIGAAAVASAVVLA
ncbi:hypothetical protein PF010_g25365 [Phytophthora fragariae]|uniref:Uncharacterized protein n=1 Tax=Phytophthora fragariae TaxID=53985 RepID=A0A6A3UA05_9STRA|nr:hypothetical protein PF009_g26556 [Phytophthora fragariae]KAE9072740.1 hypothetical protein PF010_g25365 [Phytophthora fragariae]KAE9143800.1 hypothetical protein PF006_g11208 [Phytophthora fragariae]KAE9180626.1 hypothetical protein PF002_g27511 [Phytophthora fragariae]KAE9271819.1 hypothetical protein PF001_g28209 [Phytophthora fragariae]